VLCRPYSAGILHSVSDQMQNLPNYFSTPNKIDLLTDLAALCLTDFIDWRYIHSLVGIFDPACELLPPWTKDLFL
jgi:hypothetical protein